MVVFLIKNIKKSNDGYHLSGYSNGPDYCCHSTCLECDGIGKSDCISCETPAVFADGYCITPCLFFEYYDSEAEICEYCHYSCFTCNGLTILTNILFIRPYKNNCTYCLSF